MPNEVTDRECGTVFDMEHASMQDGPGIRTVVFLKGCPLRCRWCHNPEGLERQAQLLYRPAKCTACGSCAAVCGRHILQPDADGHFGHRFDRTDCQNCGKCAEVCLSGALSVCGKRMCAGDVMREVEKDRLFYEASGGGVTLSGGEPLAQPRFTLALAKAAKAAGIGFCLETCGFAPWETIEPLLSLTELFLYDWKMTDPAAHRALTGYGNEQILANLERLSDAGARVVLRCPMIPALNDTEAHLFGIGALAERLPAIVSVHLEPYHSLGKSKAAQLGVTQEDIPLPAAGDRERWVRTVRRATAKPVTVAD